MHGLDTSNVSRRVESSQVEFELIQYKLAVLAAKGFYGTAPSYLADEFLRFSDLEYSLSVIIITVVHGCRLSATECFRLLLPVSGTNCHATSRLQRRCEFSGSRLKTSLFSRSFRDFLLFMSIDLYHCRTL